MTLGVLINKTSIFIGSLWELRTNLDCFKSEYCDELVTQASIGRSFQVLQLCENHNKKIKTIDRVKVRLLEDDYICWLKFSELAHNALKIESWKSELLTKDEIISKIPRILSWAQTAEKIKNEYLWGGTIGPNFDCSGLVQAAFASSGVWIPRDAYQQENFCINVGLEIKNVSDQLVPGDLLFFGSAEKCTHVGLHIENGFYIHSSGVINGHNGIAIDCLFPPNLGNIASFYRSQFRSAGRVISCYRSQILSKN